MIMEVAYLGSSVGALIGFGNLLEYLDVKRDLINRAIEGEDPLELPRSPFLLRLGDFLARKRYKRGMFNQIIEKYKILGESYEIPIRKEVNQYLINRLQKKR